MYSKKTTAGLLPSPILNHAESINGFIFRGLIAAILGLSLYGIPLRAGLLTSFDETMIESWLGQGDLVFTNINSKAPGDDALDFHGASDNQGATVVLMGISSRAAGAPYAGSTNLSPQIIGAYNPYPYTSDFIPILALTDAERGAFLFNLTSGLRARQNTVADDGSEFGAGIWGALNIGSLGPSFGLGPDLYVDGTLNSGYATQLSFGGANGVPLVNGTYYTAGFHSFDIGELEVYTFRPHSFDGGAVVPDNASTGGLLLFATAGLAVFRRRRR